MRTAASPRLVVLCLLVACGGTADVATPAVPPAPPADVPAVPAPTADTHFGAEFTVANSITAVEVLADPAKFAGAPVHVTGRVADVCQKAGCWMVLAEGDETLRVTMKDHEFSVAKDGAGAQCEIEGTLVAKEVDAKTVEHLEGESAKPEIMPEKGKIGETVYELVATGVKFTRGG
jgi:hypothetical protein